MNTLQTLEQTARQIIENPADFPAAPTLRAAAWAELMQARGKTVNRDSMAMILLDTYRAPQTAANIARVSHQIETALADAAPHAAETMARTRQAVQQIKINRGITTPSRNGGNAA